MKDIVETLKSLTNRAATIKVSNALNPLLWLAAVVTPLAIAACLGALWRAPESHLPTLFAILAFAPFLAVVVAYFLWAFRDPDRLQSEEFQIKQTKLLLMQKGAEAPISIEEAPNVTRAEALPSPTKEPKK